jgi:hypothetical protein
MTLKVISNLKTNAQNKIKESRFSDSGGGLIMEDALRST